MLQIVFMNMLVALMGDIQTEVTEKKEKSKLTEQIIFLNNYRNFLDVWNCNDLKLSAQYIFIITPTQNNQEEESIEDKMAQVKETIMDETTRILENALEISQKRTD